ncbi:hypothetical protein [Nitrospira sp. M1]
MPGQKYPNEILIDGWYSALVVIDHSGPYWLHTAFAQYGCANADDHPITTPLIGVAHGSNVSSLSNPRLDKKKKKGSDIDWE